MPSKRKTKNSKSKDDVRYIVGKKKRKTAYEALKEKDIQKGEDWISEEKNYHIFLIS